MIEIQRLAAATVAKVQGGLSLTAVLQEVWQTHVHLSAQQRGAIQDLSYGVLRFYGKLDMLLKLLLSKPLRDPPLRHLLLVALYQLIHSRASAHAIVNHAVSVSQTLNGKKGARGLVNAVLRNFIRQRADLLEKTTASEVGRYSYPQWWIDRLRAEYPRAYQAILDAGNHRPPMTLRINRRKSSVEEYEKRLAEHGMDSVRLWNDAIQLLSPVSVDKLPGFAEGAVSVQDAGAQLAAPLLDIQNGMRILDACAAPGGKSAHLLELAEVELTALENDAMRMAQITKTLTRLDLPIYRIVQGDATDPAKWWDGRKFDRILADVPCSASGVVRRHPDIKWLRRESDLFQFETRQAAILESLWPLLMEGGFLLYATCSVFSGENISQVNNFLRHHNNAHSLPLHQANIIDGQLLPDRHHDGFFYALLQKN